MSNRVVALDQRRGLVAARLAKAISGGSNTGETDQQIGAALAEAAPAVLPAPVVADNPALNDADMVSMAMALAGHELAAGDVLEQAQILGLAGLRRIEDVEKTLRAMGLQAEVHKSRECQPADFPAAAARLR